MPLKLTVTRPSDLVEFRKESIPHTVYRAVPVRRKVSKTEMTTSLCN